MDFFLRFYYPLAFILSLVILLVIGALKYLYARSVMYKYSLVGQLYQAGLGSSHPYKKVLNILRILSLLVLAILIGKPQLVDYRSHMHVEGIDIVLALDISGSMRFQDYEDDHRPRIEIAKDEAKYFVDKRDNDAIGLVVFGNDAVTRCPLTVDKKIIKEMIDDLHIGLVDPDGTLLCTGLMTAFNRLKQSEATSKIVILLTDGEPSQNDEAPETVIAIAKQLRIKVYTIGIGSEEAGYMFHPLYGQIAARPSINKALLHTIATETGGMFFNARNAQEMRTVYTTIDALEKTEYKTDIYNNYYDVFMPLLWIVLLLIGCEIILSSLVWFGL